MRCCGHGPSGQEGTQAACDSALSHSVPLVSQATTKPIPATPSSAQRTSVASIGHRPTCAPARVACISPRDGPVQPIGRSRISFSACPRPRPVPSSCHDGSLDLRTRLRHPSAARRDRTRRRPSPASDADLSDGRVRLRRLRPGPRPLRRHGGRVQLHARGQPHQRGHRTANRGPRGRHRRAARRQRAGGRRHDRARAGLRRRPPRLGVEHLRGLARAPEQRPRPPRGVDDLRDRAQRRRRVGGRHPARDEGAVRRVHPQPQERGARHRGDRRRRAPARAPADRRQHARHPLPGAADRARRRYRRAFGEQVPGRPRHGARRSHRRRRLLRVGCRSPPIPADRGRARPRRADAGRACR